MTTKEKETLGTLLVIFSAYLLYQYLMIVVYAVGVILVILLIIIIVGIASKDNHKNEEEKNNTTYNTAKKDYYKNKSSPHLHQNKLAEKLGKKGEQEVDKKLNKYDKDHFLIADIMLEANNKTTQIDHILITAFGIFVIETKNYKGWIFGSEYSKKWTQSLFGGKKHSFQNPIHQNYLHLKTLQEISGLPENCFFNMVVFTQKSTFKTELPESVMNIDKMMSYIESFSSKLLSKQEMNDFYEKIKYGKHKKENSRENINQHINEIQQRIN